MYYIGCTLAPPHEYDWTVRVLRRCSLFVKLLCPLVMVALWNSADHYIFILSFVLSIFFPRLISAVAECMSASGCLPYLNTWCGLSANLRCRSETCCMRLTENTAHKNAAKNRHLSTIAQLSQVISSQLRHVSTIGKKLVKQQYVLQMSAQYGELRPTSGWDWFTSFGRPS